MLEHIINHTEKLFEFVKDDLHSIELVKTGVPMIFLDTIRSNLDYLKHQGHNTKEMETRYTNYLNEYNKLRGN